MKRYLIDIGILSAIVVFLFLFGLGKMPLTDPDETFYAQTAKEMIQNNDWITPTIFDTPQFEKPVFYYWTLMGSYKVFGINEFAARFPSAIFGILGVIGIYFLGILLFSRLTGFLSAVIMATSIQYIVLARACVTDMVLTVFILYCLLFFLWSWKTGKKYPYCLSAICAAFAVLTKGPIGLFIPGMIVLIYVISTKQWRDFGKIPFSCAIIMFLLVCLPWYSIIIKLHSTTFIGEFFGFQNITRFVHPEHDIGTNPFFYLPVLFGGFFPWSLFLPVGVWYLFKEHHTVSKIKGYRTFLLSWFFLVLIFFSISRTKLVTYIFPLWPVMAIIVGRLWDRFISFTDDDKIQKKTVVSYFILVTLSLCAIIGLDIFIGIEYPAALNGVLLTSAVFAIGLLFSLFYYLRNKRATLFYALVLSIVILSFPLNYFVLPEIGRDESSKDLCLWVNELALADEPIAGESDLRRGIAFYTDRTDVPDIQNYQKEVDFFSQKAKVWGIIKKKHYVQLDKKNPGLVAAPLAAAGKKVLVTNNINSSR